jgi:hypothetical protein
MALAQPEKIVYQNLPLAVYREIAAHLRQVTGVQVELIPQDDKQFDYLQSQLGGLHVSYTVELSESDRQVVEAILSYYGDRYGSPMRQAILDRSMGDPCLKSEA